MVQLSSCHKDEAKTVPTIATGAISNLTKSSATLAANITSDGRAAVTVRGICWSMSDKPTTADNKTSNGTGTGNFSGDLTGLTANTLYYARPYATNSVGTGYGEQVSFTTDDVPSVTTGAVSNLGKTSATVAGNVTFDGHTAVTARGICWSINHNPTTSDNTTTNGTGTGAFSGDLTSLTGNTTYYARAYATNSQGTSYGAEVSILTLNDPTVTSGTATNIRMVSVTLDGNVTSDGNDPNVTRGICWSSVNTTPTTSDNHATLSQGVSSTGTGSFTADITGQLSPGTTYYARPYATNSVSTQYGSVITFSSLSTGAGLIAYFPVDNSYASSSPGTTGLTMGNLHGVSFSATAQKGSNSLSFPGGSSGSLPASSASVSAANFSSTKISFAQWMNISGTTPSSTNYIFINKQFWAYYDIDAAGTPTFYFYVSDAQASNPGTTTAFAKYVGNANLFNTWTHLAGVYDGSKVTLYINGNTVATQSTSVPKFSLSGGEDLSFGYMFTPGPTYSNYYAGLLDEIKFYNRDLSASEVAYVWAH